MDVVIELYRSEVDTDATLFSYTPQPDIDGVKQNPSMTEKAYAKTGFSNCITEFAAAEASLKSSTFIVSGLGNVEHNHLRIPITAAEAQIINSQPDLEVSYSESTAQTDFGVNIISAASQAEIVAVMI